MYDVRIGSEERDKQGSEARVLVCKLECQSGKDVLEVTAILKTSRAEERRSQPAVGKHPLRDRLCDRGFPRPSESVEPEDWRLAEVLGPTLDLAQDTLSRSVEAPAPITVLTSSPLSATTLVQHQRFSY